MLPFIARKKGQRVHGKGFRSKEVLDFFHTTGIRLGKRQYEVYTYLLGLANNNSGCCFPSQEMLATHFGISQQRISVLVRQLQSKGLLKIDSVFNQTKWHNFYIMSGVNQLAFVVKQLIQGLSDVSQEILSFFTTNIRHHIIKSDKAYLPTWVTEGNRVTPATEEEKEGMRKWLGS